MSDMHGNCLFCNIVSGWRSAKIVYEDDLVVAFWDARPVAPLHILIVPREHIPTLNDIPEDNQILSLMGKVASKIAGDFGVAKAGYRFFVNLNPGGGQVIFHLHAHLVSRSNPGTDNAVDV